MFVQSLCTEGYFSCFIVLEPYIGLTPLRILVHYEFSNGFNSLKVVAISLKILNYFLELEWFSPVPESNFFMVHFCCIAFVGLQHIL